MPRDVLGASEEAATKDYVDLVLGEHAADTTGIHGIANTANISSKAEVSELHASEEITAANTIAPKNNLALAKVKGTTEIKKVTATSDGHRLVLKFKESVKVVKGENLKLKENFEATADDTLSLVCDGTNWYEVGRSAN